MRVLYEFHGGKHDGALYIKAQVEKIADGHTRSWEAERKLRRPVPRQELDNQPTVDGYVGPMWDGIRYIVDGKLKYGFELTEAQKEGLSTAAILRYETQAVYDMLSR